MLRAPRRREGRSRRHRPGGTGLAASTQRRSPHLWRGSHEQQASQGQPGRRGGLALAAGGTTFAAWSDFSVESSSAGAGILKLNVSSRDGSTIDVEPFNLAPGQNKYQEFYLASADADNVPVGALTAQIKNLVDTEDNGPGCTTNSEAIAEAPGDVDSHGMPTNPLQRLRQRRRAVQPGTRADPGQRCGPRNAASCPNSGYHSASPSGTGTLASQTSKVFNLGDVAHGEGVCVRMRDVAGSRRRHQRESRATRRLGLAVRSGPDPVEDRPAGLRIRMRPSLPGWPHPPVPYRKRAGHDDDPPDPEPGTASGSLDRAACPARSRCRWLWGRSP